MTSFIRAAAVGLVLSLGPIGPAAAAECPDDSVMSGTVCMDKYQASVWYVPPEEKKLIDRIRKGTVKLEELLATPGVQQLGLVSGDLADFPIGCPVTGNGCVNVYAVSIRGVIPARFITWFQMAAAARNSRKRLPTNQEWQVAALGTPHDAPDAPCSHVDLGDPSGVPNPTGINPGCVSDVGTIDMGKGGEWVADWGNRAITTFGCTQWPAAFNDVGCFGGGLVSAGQQVPGLLPGAVLRTRVFGVHAEFNPSMSAPTFGFRCAR